MARSEAGPNGDREVNIDHRMNDVQCMNDVHCRIKENPGIGIYRNENRWLSQTRNSGRGSRWGGKVAAVAALDRAYWLSVVACAYTAIAALVSAGPSPWRLGATFGAPLVLAWVWRRSHLRQRRGDPGVEGQALRALRIAAAGISLWLLSRLGRPQVITLELAGTMGLGAAAVSGVYGLSRIPGAPGLLVPPRSTRSVDAAAFTAVLWSVALAVAAKDLVLPGPALDPLTLDYAVTAASVATLFILVAASLRLLWVRRLELGVGDRALGALSFSITAIAVAIPVAAMGIGPPDRVLPAFLALATICVLGCVVAVDPSFIAMSLRSTMVVVALGVPVALLTGSLARATPSWSGPIALGGAAVSVLVGLIARSAARPLGPEQSRWLLALSDASQAALVPDPTQAVIATLRALKGTAASPATRPELWRADPASVLSVNVSGTLEERDAAAPHAIYELGLREPERTLRLEVLKALQIRRPDVRELLGWFEVHKAFSATVIVDEEGPAGFLLLPTGDRTDVMTLEEARAARLLADRMSALLAVTSALERARRRQVEAQRNAENWERSFHRVQGVLEGATRRYLEAARVLARPLLAAAYSPAVRMTLAEMTKGAESAQVIVLVSPVGVAVEAWAAVIHLESGRSGPLMCVDAGVEDARDASRWLDPERSLVALCEGGTLFVRDADLLTPRAQQGLVEALTTRFEQQARSALPPPKLVLGLKKPPSALLAEGAHEALRPWLQKTVYELPRLSERPEDLRSIILDLASRSTRGPEQTPLGVERAALQALLDYGWPGNDAELRDVVERAAAASSGPLIGLGDLRAIGFAGLAAPPIPPPPPPPSLGEDRPDYRPRSRPPRARRRRA
jgi:hypothetical protein